MLQHLQTVSFAELFNYNRAIMLNINKTVL